MLFLILFYSISSLYSKHISQSSFDMILFNFEPFLILFHHFSILF